MQDTLFKKNTRLKIALIAINLLIVLILAYLVFLPMYPLFKYKFSLNKTKIINPQNANIAMDAIDLPEKEKFRLEIPKIGVEVPLIQSRSSEYGLYKGAWVDTDGSTPSKGGNTIVTAHRFKYLPPSNLTFYLIDKLEAGDSLNVFWDDVAYNYRVRETKIVENTDLSILNQTEKNIITLYSCHPIFSQNKRFVVVGELIE